jgi:hypothetical protein
MIVFWDVAPSSLVEVHRRFRGAHCLHHQDDRTSETPINFYETTRRNIPQDSYFNIASLLLVGTPDMRGTVYISVH